MDERVPFAEKLRRDLANHRHPSETVVTYRCRTRAHALMWLVAEQGQFVPVVRTEDDQFRIEGVTGAEGMQPRVLAQWRDDEHLPIGACESGEFIGPTAAEARTALRRGIRKVLLDPVPATN